MKIYIKINICCPYLVRKTLKDLSLWLKIILKEFNGIPHFMTMNDTRWIVLCYTIHIVDTFTNIQVEYFYP